MSWTIKHENDHPKGRFVIEADGKELGQMTYVFAGEQKIIIDHTEVDESLKGQGAGQALVNAGAEFARQDKLKILPLCPFAKKVMGRDQAAYADVLF